MFLIDTPTIFLPNIKGIKGPISVVLLVVLGRFNSLVSLPSVRSWAAQAFTPWISGEGPSSRRRVVRGYGGMALSCESRGRLQRAKEISLARRKQRFHQHGIRMKDRRDDVNNPLKPLGKAKVLL